MKKCKVVIEPAAQKDLDNIICYYKSIAPHLDNSFRLKSRLAMRKLKTFPQSHAVRFSNVRMTAIERFPYALHYFFEPNTNTVHIIGVFPFASDPNKGFLRSAE